MVRPTPMSEQGDRDAWARLAVETYAGMVEDRHHFALAAYRDGEWYCITGHGGGNINGEAFAPELGAMLRRTLTHPVGQWCVYWWPHPTIGRKAWEQANAWLAKHAPPVRWIPDRPVGRAAELGLAAPFFRACAARRVVLVGPAHLSRLDLFPVAAHIEVPESTAWQHVDRLCREVRGALELRGDDLVLFAAGMATNVMVHRLWPSLRGRATLYDIGATLDPYCGVYSRKVFRDPSWQRNVMPRNRP